MSKPQKATDIMRDLLLDDKEDKTKIPLDELVADFVNKHTFKVGDRVAFKKGMHSHSYPKREDEAYVVDIIDPPIIDDQADSGTPYFKMPYNIRVAMLVDGDFTVLPYCSNYFEPVKVTSN